MAAVLLYQRSSYVSDPLGNECVPLVVRMKIVGAFKIRIADNVFRDFWDKGDVVFLNDSIIFSL